MDLDLAGRISLVTGGSKGIGLACAEAFATEGARVAIASRRLEHLSTAVELLAGKGFQVTAFVADLSDASSAAELIADEV